MSLSLPNQGSGFLQGLVRNHHNTGRPDAGVKGALIALLAMLTAQLGGALILQCEQWVNPAAADVDGWVTAKATSAVEQTHAADGALAGTTLSEGRNVSVTTVGADSEFTFPMTVTVVGEYKGVAQTEDIVFASAAASPGTVQGVKPFDKVTSAVISANADVNGTVSVGTGAGLVTKKVPQDRHGYTPIYKEIVSGTGVVTSGSLSAYGVYLPASAPNGALDYFIAYEGQIYDIKYPV